MTLTATCHVLSSNSVIKASWHHPTTHARPCVFSAHTVSHALSLHTKWTPNCNIHEGSTSDESSKNGEAASNQPMVHGCGRQALGHKCRSEQIKCACMVPHCAALGGGGAPKHTAPQRLTHHRSLDQEYAWVTTEVGLRIASLSYIGIKHPYPSSSHVQVARLNRLLGWCRHLQRATLAQHSQRSSEPYSNTATHRPCHCTKLWRRKQRITIIYVP